MKSSIFLLLLFSSIFLNARHDKPNYLFKNHKEGYNVYRIPAIVSTAGGKLLAFCEGRKSLRDKGDIDLVMKSSEDNGKTWSALKVIWNEGTNTCGNPTPVIDKASGDIIVLGTMNNDKVFLLRSKDEGSTWENAQDISSEVKAENWKWYATGPVHAIQLKQSAFKDRIVVPCNHTISGVDKHISHIIYSDDHGQSWKKGGSVPNEKMDECTVAELSDGKLLLNMRSNDRSLPNRKISFSNDGGASWTAAVYDSTLIEPVCQGSLLRYSIKPDILLFSNPRDPKQRKNLSLSVSYDEGRTWPLHLEICKGKSAYNDIVVLNNGDILCLYETGKLLPYSGIALKRIRAGCLKNKP